MVSAKPSAWHASACFGNLHPARLGTALLEAEHLERRKANLRSGCDGANPVVPSRSVSTRDELPEIAGLPRRIQGSAGQIQRRPEERSRTGVTACAERIPVASTPGS